jgi:site-specific DNA-methyltransferase (adenine-specific)
MPKKKKTKKRVGPYNLRTQDIMEWAKSYTGPKFHALLCDPPYEIGFMSKGWDNSGIVFKPELWEALMEHLHPGAFCFAFSSTRTVHRMMVAIEDAGFVIHPIMLAWNQSTGFPKASNPTFAMDKLAGAERKVVGKQHSGTARLHKECDVAGRIYTDKTVAGSSDGQAFNGHRYGLQALKPAFEPIVCFQKPYPKKTKPVVSMLETGAGCLNIDAGRIGTEATVTVRNGDSGANGRYGKDTRKFERVNPPGRWPSNMLLCHLPECTCVGAHQAQCW